MNTLELTYRNYKNFVKAVPLDYSGAGFYGFKDNHREEVIDLLLLTYQGGQASDYPSTLFAVVKISELRTDNRMICNGFELVANNLVQKSEKACHLFDRLFLFTEIKGRVERDCLKVSQNKTEVPSNTYSANALCWAPTSADTCCMMRVQKETGIERGGRPENEGRPIKVRNNYSKLTLKSNLLPFFTAYQL